MADNLVEQLEARTLTCYADVACLEPGLVFISLHEDAREALAAEIPREMIKATGVWIGGWQDRVHRLRPEQALLLFKEPWNLYKGDHSCAIRIQTMNGEQVGWVPKEEVEEFMLFIELAIVESRGPKLRGPGAGRWGFHFYARKGLPPLVMDAFPHALRPIASLQALLPPDSLNMLHEFENDRAGNRRACTSARGIMAVRCAITDWAGDHLLPCYPEWHFDVVNRVATVLTEEVLQAKTLLEQEPPANPEEVQVALHTLAVLNWWTDEEAEEYLAYAQAEVERRSQPGRAWMVDFSWVAGQLKTHGLEVPQALKDMHMQ